MSADLKRYSRFTRRSVLEKSINSLLGLLEGIAIDGVVTPGEVSTLSIWLDEHSDVANRHPYTELIPAVAEAVSDGRLDPEEREDLIWLCRRLRSTEFFDSLTADLQRLHAVVGGIAADGLITVEELRGLSDWLADHEHLKSCWPYDEIETLTTKALGDGKVDPEEHALLMGFFADFFAILDERTVVAPPLLERHAPTISALCAVTPNITFENSRFCFTGVSGKYSRKEFEGIVAKLGGEASATVNAKINYLVIGAEGNPCWAYACYGRKVERAVELRKQGFRIVLVHENDFHDAVLDV